MASWEQGEVKFVVGWTTDEEESLSRAQSGSTLEGASDVRSDLRAVMEDGRPRDLGFMLRRVALRPRDSQ